MYNLSVDEISMVDGGGDGSSSHNHGEIIGGAITCGIVAAASSMTTPVGGFIAGSVCSIAGSYVSGNSNSSSSNVQGGGMSMSNVQGNAGFAGGRGL